MVALIIRALRRWRCDSGAEFVEMAMALPLLLLVVAGIMDFGLMFQQYEVLTNAAREGARIAILPHYTDADVQQRVTQYINASFLGSPASVNVVLPIQRLPLAVGANCITTAQVKVTYPHTFMFLGNLVRYFGQPALGTTTLTAQSTMRAEISQGGCP